MSYDHRPHWPPHGPPSERWRGARRFFPFVIFFFISMILFVGGTTAILYLLFSKYTGAQNIWILLCGIPFGLMFFAFVMVRSTFVSLLRPMSQIFNAIDSVAEGDLSVRVQESNSRQFTQLIKRFNRMVSELERADQQRRNLTADVAHELRTPLHIIQGNLEGIIDGVYQPTPDHINNTLDETKLLTRLVDDLQTLSLAEAGQLPLHPTRFLLAELIEDLTSSFSSEAASLGIELKINVTDPSQEITADYDRLNQVLSNLISNALRHTQEAGTISIETGTTSSGVRIVVRDTGQGIPMEDLPFIFDRFWRRDASRTERRHSGLGLAIAKQLVQAHRGTITAESEVGKGTTFVIELPVDVA